jgi:hypothetical protein
VNLLDAFRGERLVPVMHQNEANELFFGWPAEDASYHKPEKFCTDIDGAACPAIGERGQQAELRRVQRPGDGIGVIAIPQRKD